MLPCYECGMSAELRHLRAFVAIAEEGGITAAAQRLAVTQPALSRTLRQLEAHLGVRLFDRSTTFVRLSREGRALLPRAVAALAAVDDVLEPGGGRPRPLRVGYAWSAAGPHTPAILQAWAAARPEVGVELLRLDDRYAGLTRGLVDLAVLRGDLDADDLHLERLTTEPRVAVLPLAHPLAAADAVVMADLATSDLVVNTVSGTVSPQLWPAGARPGIALRVRTVEDWLIAIAAGQGIGLTAVSTAELHARPGVAFVPVVDAPPMPVFLAWREGPGHPARADFARLARNVVRGSAQADQAQPGPPAGGEG